MPAKRADKKSKGKKKTSYEEQVEDEEEVSLRCPKCGSDILDISKGPEIIRCIVCKHIFEHETEEARERRIKEAPHRIRKLSRLSMLFKKPVEEFEKEGEDERFKVKRTREEQTKLIVMSISIGLMIVFFILAALNGVKYPVEEGGEIKEKSILPPIILQETQKEIEVEEGANVHVEKYYVQLDWLGFIMIGLCCGFGPIGFYESRKNDQVVRLEENLADFLRDLAESSRSGQTAATRPSP